MTNFILSGELRVSYLARLAGASIPVIVLLAALGYAAIKSRQVRNKDKSGN